MGICVVVAVSLICLCGFAVNKIPSCSGAVFLTLNLHYYSTIMSFYQIRSRERAKYVAVIRCSVLV